MDPNVFHEGLGLRNPDPSQVQFALALFALEYVNTESKQITDYSPFINNYSV